MTLKNETSCCSQFHVAHASIAFQLLQQRASSSSSTDLILGLHLHLLNLQVSTLLSMASRWLRPEVYPLFAAVGVAVGICGFQLVRNICINPEVRVSKQTRTAGVLDNFAEGEKYAEHFVRKFARNRSSEIMPSINWQAQQYWQHTVDKQHISENSLTLCQIFSMNAYQVLSRCGMECEGLETLCIKDLTITNENAENLVVDPDAKLVLSCESIQHGIGILQLLLVGNSNEG